MDSSSPRKSLWLSIRTEHPNLSIKPGKDFEAVVEKRLLSLLKLIFPLTLEQHEFVSCEAHNFAKNVTIYWQKCSRNQSYLFSKHESYFAKKYPDFVFCAQTKNSVLLKRPFDEKSRSQQWRDCAKVAKEDRDVVIGGAALVFEREGHRDAAYVVKRLKEDPSIAGVLRKALEDLDSQANDRLICFLID